MMVVNGMRELRVGGWMTYCTCLFAQKNLELELEVDLMLVFERLGLGGSRLFSKGRKEAWMWIYGVQTNNGLGVKITSDQFNDTSLPAKK